MTESIVVITQQSGEAACLFVSFLAAGYGLMALMALAVLVSDTVRS